MEVANWVGDALFCICNQSWRLVAGLWAELLIILSTLCTLSRPPRAPQPHLVHGVREYFSVFHSCGNMSARSNYAFIYLWIDTLVELWSINAIIMNSLHSVFLFFTEQLQFSNGFSCFPHLKPSVLSLCMRVDDLLCLQVQVDCTSKGLHSKSPKIEELSQASNDKSSAK